MILIDPHIWFLYVAGIATITIAFWKFIGFLFGLIAERNNRD